MKNGGVLSDDKKRQEFPVHAGARTWLALLAFISIGGFFLFTEHRAHFFGILPYLLLVACPLLHLLSHGKHGTDGQDHGEQAVHTEPPKHGSEGGNQ